ncbi:MAG: exodeoxyribonuclease VII large subunit [Bacteroidales bacterium]|nr:exodeoxyribonuclease VII large subunit [Bacteroidales bacterium]MBR6161436.1 exodeoxyribonuclease VII large subunit [Bacteroidales bacterium]
METRRETFQDYPVYSLSEIAFSLHKVVERTYPQPYYIKAEILKLNYYPHSGHCYPELVEKEGNTIKAEMRAIIWASHYQRINERFIQITGNPLKENISILCLANIEFSPKHGLALHIQDIEPSYTLGEMVKNRNAVIERLKKEGVFTANKRLEMPLLPKRIAVISVETSKGFSDFMTTLNGNRYGYRFETELFPSILQGDKAITGITGRLAEIEMRRQEFDCVVIVRGGGGDVGLSCYDEYEMAHCVATFPLPVLTGIGHSTNLSVTDMVAHKHNITPTDVAVSLIDCFHSFDEQVKDLQHRIVTVGKTIVAEQQALLLELDARRKVAVPKVIVHHRTLLGQLSQNMVLKAKELLIQQQSVLDMAGRALDRQGKLRIASNREHLERFSDVVKALAPAYLSQQRERVGVLEEKIQLLHPNNILKRGFSITRYKGKAITEASELKPGDELVTQVYEGEVKSRVE